MEKQQVAVGGKSEDARRRMAILETWRKDEHDYAEYLRAVQRLLDLKAADLLTSRRSQVDLPKGVLGEPNSIEQLEDDAARPSQRVNYFHNIRA